MNLEINWRDRTDGRGLATALALTPVHRAGAVEVFDHPRLGRALVVDGALQDIDDDRAWRELLVHVPLLGHPRAPADVLVVGGGDGRVVREVLRHGFVARVQVWETDAAVLDAGRRFFGADAAWADPRVRRVDAPEGRFDVILVARPDLRRGGDAVTTAALAAALADDGVLVDADAVVIGGSGARWARSGPTVRDAAPRVARYFGAGVVVPGGFHVFEARGHAPIDLRTPRERFVAAHYNADLHRAAFALPRVLRELP